VIGAGGWGTALSVIWARQGRAILLCGNNPSRVEELRASRENSAYLPGVNLPEAIGLTSDLHSCADADLIVFVTPSTALRETAARLGEVKINSNAVLLSCIKGIEHGTGKRMSEILEEIFPHHTIAVLSGPNLAAEVSRELPTATVLHETRLRRGTSKISRHGEVPNLHGRRVGRDRAGRRAQKCFCDRCGSGRRAWFR